MPDSSRPNFFRSLRRREVYSTKPDGSYYAYSYYRANFQHEIAQDCMERCVYCDSHENEMGGREAMQLDHFRPYTRAGFEHLKDDPYNFHHACARCNLLKSDNWPSSHPTEPHDGTVGFIDPFGDERNRYFEVRDDGTLVSKRPPAEYLIRLLGLNRRHLRLLRVRRVYCAMFRTLAEITLERMDAACRGETSMTLAECRDALTELLTLHRLCSPLEPPE